MTFIIDTNVISELRKRERADQNLVKWAERTDPSRIYMSVITLIEVQYGALLVRRRDAIQGDMMLRWVSNDVVPNFSRRILGIDRTIALASAALHIPNRLPDRDAYIAATALVHELTVVTRNTRDFAGTGVKTFSPWVGG